MDISLLLGHTDVQLLVGEVDVVAVQQLPLPARHQEDQGGRRAGQEAGPGKQVAVVIYDIDVVEISAGEYDGGREGLMVPSLFVYS